MCIFVERLDSHKMKEQKSLCGLRNSGGGVVVVVVLTPHACRKEA